MPSLRPPPTTGGRDTKLRESRGLTTDGLARLMFYNRAKISRLENAQVRPDLAEIMNMLNALEITGSQYDKFLKLAHEAAQKGWWDKYGVSMGPRQKLYADLEYNAETVREYNQTLMPAVLQAPGSSRRSLNWTSAKGRSTTSRSAWPTPACGGNANCFDRTARPTKPSWTSP